MKRLLYILFISLIVAGCAEDEVVFDTPFVYVSDNDKGTSQYTNVDSRRSGEDTYAIHLCAGILSKDLEVVYDVECSESLTNGVDFEFSGPKSVVFPANQSLAKYPIRITWLPNEVDETKQNWVRIVIKSNSQGLTIGYPGPDKLRSYYQINVINMP